MVKRYQKNIECVGERVESITHLISECKKPAHYHKPASTAENNRGKILWGKILSKQTMSFNTEGLT